EAKLATDKLKLFNEDKTIINEIKSLSLFLKIEAASKKKVDEKKIIQVITNLIEKYPDTEGARRATSLLLNNGN
ncbi:MAG: hypothetical protein NE328_22475, partial [Lentisphaeraceae bacterium]|nr:hypothetical protein [Lentisphaeraceae bacterium]